MRGFVTVAMRFLAYSGCDLMPPDVRFVVVNGVQVKQGWCSTCRRTNVILVFWDKDE